MRKNLLITPTAMILVSGAISLYAQDLSTGSLTGRVTGQDGRPLRGVNVTLNSPALLTPRQFTTDANGQFRAQMLMPGNYTITYVLNGYMTRRLTTYVAAGQTIRGDMQLRSQEVQTETVEIVASSSQQVDKTDTVTASVMSQQKLLELTGGASIGGLIAFIPGVTTGDGTQYKIRGSTNAGTKAMVDGGNVTNMAEGTLYGFRAPMVDAIESVAVIQSPLNARYGNTDGGLISYVLSKGSNQFKGSLRTSISRGQSWGTFNGTNFPNNRGEMTTYYPSHDNMSKSYDFFLSGPIWKDHITFSWTGAITPTTRSTFYQYQSTDLWVSGNGSSVNPSRYKVGTYYKNWDTGEVIRKAELMDASDPMNLIPYSSVSKNDTYTLFYQVTQNHQVEWSYHESYADRYNPTNYGMADMTTNPVFVYSGSGGNQRRWNLSYKGIIGSSGLFEARFGRSDQTWFNLQVDRRPKHAVRVLTMPSLTPFTGTDVGNPDNYYASGLIDSRLYRNDSVKNTASQSNGNYTFNATNEGPGDGALNEPINVNYQHILETSFGRHILDVGVQREKSSWYGANLYSAGVNAERLIISPGRISSTLTQREVINPAGTPLSEYRDKFIVFNMNFATFNSVDPYGANRFNKGTNQAEPRDLDVRLIDYNNGNGWEGGVNGIWPMLSEQYGGIYSSLYVQQMSYYLNDFWTINDHHSIMGGLRYDKYRVWHSDGDSDIYSYNMPTLRFEYKFDIFGDQRRVVNVSWGQFHNMAAVSPWGAFMTRGIRENIWNVGPTNGRPYLVDFDDIMNKDNYRVFRDTVSGGVNKVADGYKGLVNTEFTLGIRFNLENGGSLRATFVQRNNRNDYQYFFNGFVDNPNGGGKVLSRLLDNVDGIERSYKGLELEWDIPITGKTSFGGSYNFSRLMENGIGETNSPSKTALKSVYYDNYVNEQFDFPYWGYNPVRLQAAEHRFNGYINYDLTYGKVKSNAALRFYYNSSGPGTRSFGYIMGYPIIPGLTTNRAGEGQPTSQMGSSAGIPQSKTVFYNIHRTGNSIDDWSTNLTYNLELPVTNRVRWYMTVTCSNPFNHWRKSGWYAIEGWVNDGSIIPETIYRDNGSVFQPKQNPYDAGGMKSDNIQNSSAGLFAPNQRSGGRSLGLVTGLRF